MAATPRPFRPSAMSDNDALNSMMPAASAKTITPNDSTYFSKPVSAIYVGTGGNIAVVHEQDTDGTRDTVIVYKNVPSGFYLQARIVKVYATNTTATDLIALSS